ncbi:putative ArsR family transcriptional regulator [Agromyces cerinus]|uniref:helix-turn-helix transcriptional regulator n=1 Tax=Agromyces cerinus TaxID=33878 RepID=UPI00195AB73D|nr:helix-turn-helix domain-containing protein [Agromyces cerinus]MBM7829828.1 putative ArsR family transcriptional regulator [Agromyces cerinus]
MSLPDTEAARTFGSYSRVALLHRLQQRAEQTVAELAAAVDLHHNTTREHLQRLIDDGFVTAHPEHRTSRGRPRMLYSAATGNIDEMNRPALRRLRNAIERNAVERPAGSRDDGGLGRDAMRQIDALSDHLDQCGFDQDLDRAQLTAEQVEVNLAGCPFQSMVDEHGDVVCSVHLGVIRSVLTHADGPIEARELLPLTATGCCTLQLAVEPD